MAEALGNYEHMSQTYGTQVDESPVNKLYERPNTWSLLPADLKGLKVLDLGCGSGWYSEQMLKAGAIVTGVDVSETLLKLAKEKCKGEIDFFQADLEKPLDFLKDQEFDLILSALVIHYIEDWGPLFKEISRVLKPKGTLVLSTHHTGNLKYQKSEVQNYFEREIIKEYWDNYEAEVTFYHHPISELTESLYEAGFLIERLLEPQFSQELKEKMPGFYERNHKKAHFLFLRALKRDL